MEQTVQLSPLLKIASMVKLKASCLLLLIGSLPRALCSLNNRPSEGKIESDSIVEQPQLRALNVTNEISYFPGHGLQVIDVIEPEWDESPREVATFLDFISSPALANVDSQRELRYSIGTMEVVFENRCVIPFHVAAKYNKGGVTEEWYLLGYKHAISFFVQDNQFSIYAASVDGNYMWQGEPASKYCTSGRCFKDYTIHGNPTKFTIYISCHSSSDQGPSPTPRPQTLAPVPVQIQTRARRWQDAHNRRRLTLHSSSVTWHDGIANSAQDYAIKLGAIDGCVIQHGYQGDSYGGENLAANWGSSGYRPSPDEVLTRWFEEEADLEWPANGHYSQVAWKAIKYVGCGEIEKSYQGGHCFIQVCRYITPGNCNVGSAPLEELMLMDSSPCEPESP